MYLSMASAVALLLVLPLEGVVAQSSVPQGYQLTFSEEFTGLSLDPTCSATGTWATYWCKWNVRNLSGNNDLALKADPAFRGSGGPTLAEHGLLTHERTSGNTLKLFGRPVPTAIRSQYYNFSYVGGMISSEHTHAQTYGYWEIRARFTNTSKGHHWAMWLVPEDGSWPPEIDIVEVVGDNPNRFYMNSHGDGGPLTWFSPEDPRGWHTFGLLWTPDDLVWYVDQVERKRIRNFIDKPLYWLLSPEIGSNWAGSPDGSTVWPMEAEVDYVRVYELGSAATPDITAPSVPADLTAAAVSSSLIELLWAPSTDDVGVTRYDVYRGTVLRGATEDLFFNDPDLAASTTYNYRVSACDAADNCSEFSDWVSATTDDPDPPSPVEDDLQITALQVNAVGWCSEIEWTTSEPADSLVEYGTEAGAMNRSVYQITPTIHHRMRLSGLSKKTQYYFRAASVDDDGDTAISGVGTFKSRPNTKC